MRQKYSPQSVYLFIGLVPERTSFYKHLQECGFVLVFKQTVSIGGKVKGNCDAELVLQTITDFYTKKCDSFVLVTGDGDFGCVVEFLKNEHVFNTVLAPDKKKCSILLKNKNVSVDFLNDHYHKFSLK